MNQGAGEECWQELGLLVSSSSLYGHFCREGGIKPMASPAVPQCDMGAIGMTLRWTMWSAGGGARLDT